MLIFDVAMFQTNVATTYSKYFIRSGHHATSDNVTVRIFSLVVPSDSSVLIGCPALAVP